MLWFSCSHVRDADCMGGIDSLNVRVSRCDGDLVGIKNQHTLTRYFLLLFRYIYLSGEVAQLAFGCMRN